MSKLSPAQLDTLAQALKQQAGELGFADCAITLPDASHEAASLQRWLEQGYQGDMDYLTQNIDKRLDPTLLVPGTQRIIMLRMNYLPADAPVTGILRNPDKAYVARYTLGRDYHKLIRKRLKQLGQWLDTQVEDAEVRFRPFVDSAPVLERPLARNAGLGWIGKHTLLLNRQAGSWFLLGELFIDLPLPIDPPETESHCGRCSACIDICPTQAFPEPGVLDARRCISYLTIEYRGSIPLELRPLMGNRIFGCDDCQLICPWNRFAKRSHEADFQPRHNLDQASLLELFEWDEATFLKRTEGSAIRRTGYDGWQRNLAVALGNGRGGEAVTSALRARRDGSSPLVREHIDWALEQLANGDGPRPLPILAHPGARRLPE
ncbi:tRNA epoxyqueuosine(34) reductase QueG [Marinobacterium marinum]|uniref:Epoxyqueuosine reductase n=1 Tax=Marinobacterium marinum TaxID=2756129 RepID=A0A7W2ADG0_9GAMM|nr:tRNA epoxyqueuosine(34) reductase QueG [Marinobacterium marinum]MBA4503517.1 tRNA epoxyqueuosine(34) reductase QueG [Marinobacterium marinum]